MISSVLRGLTAMPRPVFAMLCVLLWFKVWWSGFRVMYCGGCAAAAACGWLAAVCRIAEHRLSMYIHIQYATTNARNCVRKPNRVPFIKDME